MAALALILPSAGFSADPADAADQPVYWSAAEPAAAAAPEPSAPEEKPTAVEPQPAVPASEADRPVYWTEEESSAAPAAEPEAPAEEPTEAKPAAAVEEKVAPEAGSWLSPRPNTAKKARYTGRLRLDYDYRKQGDSEDNDIYTYWYGSGYDMAGGRLDVYTSGRIQNDLDDPSTPPSQADDPYVSVSDTDDAMDERLLQLYADVHDVGKRAALRAGRQYIDIADYLHLDGAQATFLERTKLGGRVYAGQPVSYYSSLSGDLAAGISLQIRPWEGNRTRFTVARYEDDEEGGTDHNYFFDSNQELSEISRVRGQLSVLNEEFRMGRGDFYYFSPDGEGDLVVGASYWGSFDAETRAYSPLYEVLGEAQPYSYLYARLTQLVVPTFYVAPGVSYRFVDSAGGDDYANRNYSDYELAFIYEPSRAFNTSISLQYWNVEDYDEFLGVTWDVRYRYLKLWELSAGTAYAQYNYDTYSDFAYSANGGQTVITESGSVIEESPYVYTYFLRGKWRVTKKLILKLQGDIEDNSETGDLAYRARSSIEVRY